MEKKYQKIGNIFKFDAKYREILDLNEPYSSLANITWIGTEKIDGTNTRIYWDGYRFEFGGRQDNSVIQENVMEMLNKTFDQKMEYIFEQVFGEKKVYLFGEAYGPKVQTNGHLYGNEVKFILFDVNVDGYDLDRNSVNDVADKLGLDAVPVLFEGTIPEAIQYVRQGRKSTINSDHIMEGIVLEPKNMMLYERGGKRIKCKVKYMDMIKGGLAGSGYIPQ